MGYMQKYYPNWRELPGNVSDVKYVLDILEENVKI